MPTAILDDIGIGLTIALIVVKSWRDAKSDINIKSRIEEVHDQVKSPNGTTTAESVELLKRHINTIDNKLQNLSEDVKEVKTDVSDLAIYVGQKQRSAERTTRKNPPRSR